jgi:hypothetical protein
MEIHFFSYNLDRSLQLALCGKARYGFHKILADRATALRPLVPLKKLQYIRQDVTASCVPNSSGVPNYAGTDPPRSLASLTRTEFGSPGLRKRLDH